MTPELEFEDYLIPPDSRISVSHQDGVCYIKMSGDADVDFVNTFSRTAQQLEEDDKDTMLVMDMQAIDYMDSATISIFVKLVKMYQKTDRKIIVFKPRSYVEKLFGVTGLQKLVSICRSKKELDQYLPSTIPEPTKKKKSGKSK